jgi:nucleoside-diphosphate-sugar epimerase
MRVAIAGGHGKIALRLARLLYASGDDVLSIIRKDEQIDDVRATGARPVVCDLETADGDLLARAIGSVDAVVFAAGAGPGSGPERKWTVDYGGAVKLIEAAHINQIDRYVMISSAGADPEAPGDDTFAVYLRAKGRADDELVQSGLDYTIVRPTGLTDELGDGRVHIEWSVEQGRIPRDDVAMVLWATLHEPATSKKIFGVTDGETDIEEALRLA